MIRTFRHKWLAQLWATGRTGRIDRRLHKPILVRPDVLDKALRVEDLNVPGLGFHRLQGFAPPRYTIHVNGPWCVTFE
jgi:proteic killer suppression protein